MAGTMFSDHGEEAEARELWQTLTGSKSHCQTERSLPVCSLAFECVCVGVTRKFLVIT